MEVAKLVNVNLGVLGHVDSGKTSLCKALSTTASTAAFDSSPQSKERGITLDLGFSALTLDNKWSVTLVDCPGHASLIRTVLGGVQIMDLMLLIIDINKGMQPQAAECLILAQICCPNLIVVLNKVDLLDKLVKAAKIEKVRSLMSATLAKTKFVGEPIVCVSATDLEIGTFELKTAIVKKLEQINLMRQNDGPFLMAIDHCFTIKGSGTVCTGTVLQGILKIGESIEFPELQITKKVKTMQMFRTSVNEASAGDRVALGIPGLDAKLVERAIISSPGLIRQGTRIGIMKINRIQYYNRSIFSRKRYHVTIGYATVTALITVFGENSGKTEFDLSQQYEYVEQLDEDKYNPGSTIQRCHFALLEFDKSITVLPNAKVIGSNLQDVENSACRLAFSGNIIDSNLDKDYQKSYLPKIKIFKWKAKTGIVDRIVSSTSIIARGFCKRSSKIEHLTGLKLAIVLYPDELRGSPEDAEVIATGRMESRFGQTNKVRISIDSPLSEEQVQRITANLKLCGIHLKYKKFLFKDVNENSHKLAQ